MGKVVLIGECLGRTGEMVVLTKSGNSYNVDLVRIWGETYIWVECLEEGQDLLEAHEVYYYWTNWE